MTKKQFYNGQASWNKDLPGTHTFLCKCSPSELTIFFKIYLVPCSPEDHYEVRQYHLLRVSSSTQSLMPIYQEHQICGNIIIIKLYKFIYIKIRARCGFLKIMYDHFQLCVNCFTQHQLFCESVCFLRTMQFHNKVWQLFSLITKMFVWSWVLSGCNKCTDSFI